MSELQHGTTQANGINIHYVTQGEGPLVVFCHGWPESWYSWRHQLPAIAEAGYRVVAMSMRGYGKTDAPEDIGAYTISHNVGDVVGVVNSLGEDTAVVVGHDWGAPVAWYSALMRPDLFRAVGALSVPFMPPIGALPEPMTVNDVMAMTAGEGRDYYRLYFQEPGKAEADLEADLDRTIRGILYTVSGDAVSSGDLEIGWDGFFPKGEAFTDQLIIPDELPQWLTEDDIGFYVDSFRERGLRGGFNWYRNINALPAALAPWVGTRITQPSLYMGGSTDLIAGNTPENIETTRASMADLRHLEIIEGAGHWLQQEYPDEVNAALISFLDSL